MTNNDQNFWPSYVDVMTSLFFVVLVLFAISYRLYSKELDRLEVKAEEAEKIKEIHSTLEVLLKDTAFFIYEEKYKRYRLSQDVQFVVSKSQIAKDSILNFETTKQQLKETGKRLQNVLDTLLKKKLDNAQNGRYGNLSYAMIISGRASQDGPEELNYPLSYRRAYNLYKFWKSENMDFDSEKYREIIDLQIAGVGEGGVGRFSIENDIKK